MAAISHRAAAAGITRISGHTVAGLESHSFVLAAPTAEAAVRLVKQAAAGHQLFVDEENVNPFPIDASPPR